MTSSIPASAATARAVAALSPVSRTGLSPRPRRLATAAAADGLTGEAIGGRQGRRLGPGQGGDGGGYRVLGGLLDRAGVAEQVGAVDAGDRLGGGDGHLAGGDRAGLVEDHGVDPAGGLEGLVALDEDAELGAAAKAEKFAIVVPVTNPAPDPDGRPSRSTIHSRTISSNFAATGDIDRKSVV